MQVQMLEVYNEQVRDLLVEEDGRGVRLEIQNTMAAGTNVPDAIQIVVESAQDVLDVRFPLTSLCLICNPGAASSVVICSEL
jgi:hypothetical protein